MLQISLRQNSICWVAYRLWKMLICFRNSSDPPFYSTFRTYPSAASAQRLRRRGPALVKSNGLKPSLKAGDSGFKVKSPFSGSTNSGSARGCSRELCQSFPSSRGKTACRLSSRRCYGRVSRFGLPWRPPRVSPHSGSPGAAR